MVFTGVLPWLRISGFCIPQPIISWPLNKFHARACKYHLKQISDIACNFKMCISYLSYLLLPSYIPVIFTWMRPDTSNSLPYVRQYNVVFTWHVVVCMQDRFQSIFDTILQQIYSHSTCWKESKVHSDVVSQVWILTRVLTALIYGDKSWAHSCCWHGWERFLPTQGTSHRKC